MRPSAASSGVLTKTRKSPLNQFPMGNIKSRNNANLVQIKTSLINNASRQQKSSKMKPIIHRSDPMQSSKNEISEVKDHRCNPDYKVSIKDLQNIGFL